ncbi:hypothetical protein P8818_20890 [Bacillus velezensis]|nr:hypothetical protein [Bacillus velezensis]MEC0389989.1 hypothetical protein [Bacillus velezensis]
MGYKSVPTDYIFFSYES